MIDAALQFLLTELNAYMVLRTGASFGSAEMGRLVDDLGKSAIKEDRLGAAVLKIDEERTLKSQLPSTTFVNGLHVTQEPELKVDLHVMIAANFRQYDQALRQISHVLTFFQSHRIFERERYPGLDARIEKLVVELEYLEFEQVNQIWSFVGGKQLPSVVYRVRLLALQDLEPSSIAPPIMVVIPDLHEL